MKKALLSGSTGFLGPYFMAALNSAEYSIETIGRKPNNDYKIDFEKGTSEPINGEFDLVVHNAGKAHVVPKNEREATEFMKVNFEGTRLLIDSLSGASIKQFVLISTVAVYGVESGVLVSEDQKLGAQTPYGISKIKAEELVQDLSIKNNVSVVILRLPLVAGKSAPGNLGAMVRGIKTGKYFSIAQGKARKSIVLASDVAELVSQLPPGSKGVFNLSDGYDPSFGELEEVIASQLDKKTPLSLPKWIAGILGVIGDLLPFPINSDKVKKITTDLTFDSSRAKKDLNWSPNKVTEHYRI